MKLSSLLFGQVDFDEGEEYLRFRYHFILILILWGMVITGTFVLANWTGLNDVGLIHTAANIVLLVASLLLILVLRGRKHLFLPVTWVYAVLNYAVFVSALLHVPADELRVVWFFQLIAGVFILLGRQAGVATTLASVGGIVVINGHLSQPYSSNAMATIVLSLAGSCVFFYAYTGRSLSFYRRMVDANAQLRILSSRDPLTGLLNARAYYETTDRLLRLSLRNGTPFSMLFIDLDHFKSINDRHGHEAGDKVLRETAACLASQARRSDALGRIGGEEFSMFLSNTDLKGAMALAETLRQNLESLMPVIGDTPLRVTASIGVASNQPGYHNVADIQRQADLAMYQAKAQGRNRVTSLDTLAA
ncbi:MAG: GGDEF domain-containing protein [Magnetococcus sp. WYHC-3]